MGMGIFVHPWEMLGRRSSMDRYWLKVVGWYASRDDRWRITSMIFGGVFDRVSKTQGHVRACGWCVSVHRWADCRMGINVRPDLVRSCTMLSDPREVCRKVLGRLHYP